MYKLGEEVKELSDIPSIFRRYNPCNKSGNYEFYCQEFAYSTIYGNLNLKNLDYIMELLGLEVLPQVLFLVRVDDCYDIYNSFPRFSIYPQKTQVTNQLQRILENKNIKSVVASFLGRDTIGVFLCISQNTSKAHIENLAKELINEVNKQVNESISISISSFCKDINEFPTAYSQCQKAFIKNFNKGRGTYTFYDNVKEKYVSLKPEEMEGYVSRIIFYIDNLNTKGYTQYVHEMIEHISSTNTSPIDTRMYMIKFIEQISNYYISKGVKKEKLDYISLEAMKETLNSNFLSSIEQILIVFCDEIMKNSILIHQNTEEKTRVFIEECVKKYYADCNFNLAKSAKLCNYSPYYFGRLFKVLFNISFNQYLTNYRIEKAKEFLTKSQLTVEEIAFNLGFCSVSYFCTIFKRTVGLTPKQYSKENRLS